MRKLLTAVVFCWMLHAVSASAESLPDLHQVFGFPVDVEALHQHPFVIKSAQTDVVRASFEQHKTIPALSRPLVSKGEVVFVKQLGVRWLTLKPFRQLVLMTPELLVQEDSRGNRRVIASGAHPSLAAVTDVFTVLLEMNPADLHDRFTVFSFEEDGGWCIGLEPKNRAWTEWVRAIVLQGVGADMHEMMLFDSNGDRSLLKFNYGKKPHAALTAEEQEWFNLMP